MRLKPAALGILLGLGVGVIVASLTPAGAGGFLETLWRTLTGWRHMEAVIRFAAPVAVSGAGLAIAYRAGFITIGAEGQILLSSIAALYVYAYTGLAAGMKPLAAIALSLLVGGAWGLVPGLLRAYMGVNEVLSSLMLNYVALSTVNYLVSGPMRSGAFTKTVFIGEEEVLGAAWIMGAILLVAAGLEALPHRTMLGAALDAYGTAPRAARTYLITRERAILYAALISGLAGGLAGYLMLTGFQRGFTALSHTPGYGYMGVLAAWLGMRRPIGALLASVLFAFFIVAGFLLQPLGVPASFALLIQAMAVLGATVAVARGGRSG